MTTKRTNKWNHKEGGEPWTWTMAVTYVAPHLRKMKKYQSTYATQAGLAWWWHHILIMNSDAREGPIFCLCLGLHYASMGLQSVDLLATSWCLALRWVGNEREC